MLHTLTFCTCVQSLESKPEGASPISYWQWFPSSANNTKASNDARIGCELLQNIKNTLNVDVQCMEISLYNTES